MLQLTIHQIYARKIQKPLSIPQYVEAHLKITLLCPSKLLKTLTQGLRKTQGLRALLSFSFSPFALLGLFLVTLILSGF